MDFSAIQTWLDDPANHDQDPESKQGFLESGKYETTNLKAVGISNKSLQQYAARLHRQHKKLSLDAILPKINETMTQSDIFEFRLLCLFLLERYKKQFDQDLFDLIDQNWIDAIDYWALADHLSMNVFTHFPLEEEFYQQRLFSWLESDHYWRRRLALTAYVKRARTSPALFDPILKTATVLLPEDNYYIRKALSWTLREGYRKHEQHQDRLFEFVKKHLDHFTKTMLRETIRYLDDHLQELLLHSYDEL